MIKRRISTRTDRRKNRFEDPNKKWSTVVFSELPSEPAKSEAERKKEKVSSLTKRFETKNMKDNEAYVIM